MSPFRADFNNKMNVFFLFAAGLVPFLVQHRSQITAFIHLLGYHRRSQPRMSSKEGQTLADEGRHEEEDQSVSR